MKKNMNVIQIRGIRGLLIAIFVGCCLAAGFIAFPGFLCMAVWNLIAEHVQEIPSIGIIQGLLLWGILIASYFAFKKDRVVVCFKTPQGLSEDELKAVFADLKKQSEEDPVLQAMLKAREAEHKLQKESPDQEKETVASSSKDNE